MKGTNVFFEVACLTEHSRILQGLALCKKWFKKADKRALGESLQKFVSYNQSSFKFLEVVPSISGTDQRAAIGFRTSRFIGAVPLRSPDTGKQIGDFVVSPRFVGIDRFTDYIEILDLLGSEISPEVVDSLPLVSGRNFQPPFYLEAAKFIGSLEQVLKHPWRKFDNVEIVSNEPSGQINWRKYVQYENRAENKLRFPIRRNVLSELHREYGQLRFVFDICNKELTSPNTPQRVRSAFQSRLTFIQNRLYLHKPISTETIASRANDSPRLKDCKRQANRILKRELADSTAWRVDFNDVFEKFVQYVFKDLASSIGGRLAANPRIQANTRVHYAWELRHLEPDAILRTDDIIAFVDAKYKSHLYNKFEISELLKDDFRRDLHQVLAYTSFAKTSKKIGIICYPSPEVEIKSTRFRNALNDATSRILVVGIPLKRSVIPQAVRQIASEIDEIRAESESLIKNS
jgi:hypothetical protein